MVLDTSLSLLPCIHQKAEPCIETGCIDLPGQQSKWAIAGVVQLYIMDCQADNWEGQVVVVMIQGFRVQHGVL